jgi:hypothetical protein
VDYFLKLNKIGNDVAEEPKKSIFKNNEKLEQYEQKTLIFKNYGILFKRTSEEPKNFNI